MTYNLMQSTEMSFLHDHDHDEECPYSITFSSAPFSVHHHEPDCPSYFDYSHMHCDYDDEEEDSSEVDGSSLLSDCECENCELKAESRIMRFHSHHTGKGSGQVKKRLKHCKYQLRNSSMKSQRSKQIQIQEWMKSHDKRVT